MAPELAIWAMMPALSDTAPMRYPGAMGQRPRHIKPPAHLSKSPLVPVPEPITTQHESGGPKGLEPTRYGDWENNGICWDF